MAGYLIADLPFHQKQLKKKKKLDKIRRKKNTLGLKVLSNQDLRGQNPRKVRRHDAVLLLFFPPRKQVVDLNAILQCKADQREGLNVAPGNLLGLEK